MDPPLLTSCPHVQSLCNRTSIRSLSRAAIHVFTAANRPVIGLSTESVPCCLHPNCIHPASRDLFVCTTCVHVACHFVPSMSAGPPTSSRRGIPPSSAKTPLPHSLETKPPLSHVAEHAQTASHMVFLSIEFGHLYCASCDDFVFNQFLDSAIALHSQRLRARRQRYFSFSSPLDLPVTVEPPPPPRSPAPLHKKPRLLTPSTWAPTEYEVRAIAAHSSLFPIGKVRSPVGLFNLGNSCYMNSVLQAFLNAPPLRNFFLADLHKPACPRDSYTSCFACAIERLVCDSCFIVEARAFGREKGVVSTSALPVPFLVPHTVLDIVWRNVDQLASYSQHDAHEFLIAALNLLNAHCLHDASTESKHEDESDLPEIKLHKEKSHQEKSEGADRKHNDTSPDPPTGTLRAPRGGIHPADNARFSANERNDDANPKREATSIVQSLFSGTLQSDVICSVCGNSSATLEKFYDISLDVDKPPRVASISRRGRGHSPNFEGNGAVPDRGMANGTSRWHVYGGASGKGKHDPRSRAAHNAVGLDTNGHGDGGWSGSETNEYVNSLNECLNRFTEPELLGSGNKMDCIVCGCRQEAMKQMSIRTLPPIVCFHFKRFEQSYANVRRSEMVKIDTAVEFPADGLDLSFFQTSEILSRRNRNASLKKSTETGGGDVFFDQSDNLPELRENEHAIYDLFAVVNHVGKIDSGHYTALVRREGAWFRCDDEKVNMVKDVQKVVRSEEAYLIFYVQRYVNIQFGTV